jgi:hypothetical protein
MQSLRLFFKPWCLVLAQFSSIYLFNLSNLSIRTSQMAQNECNDPRNFLLLLLLSLPNNVWKLIVFALLLIIFIYYYCSEMKWTLYWRRYFWARFSTINRFIRITGKLMQSLLLFFKPWCLVLAQFSSIYLFNLSNLSIRTSQMACLVWCAPITYP